MKIKSSFILISILISFSSLLKAELIINDTHITIPYEELEQFAENKNTDSLNYKIRFAANYSFIIYPNNLNYELINHGKKRGVNLYTLLLNGPQDHGSDIKIEFENKINVCEINPIEKLHFHGIINHEHINHLISRKNKNRPTIQNNKQWYDPNINYAEIITNSDNVYRIPLSEIIKEIPEIRGQRTNYLHAIMDGEAYSNFYIQDSDLIIDDSDILYLKGYRHRGDSTFYDHYTDKKSIYFYLDLEKESQQLDLLTANGNPIVRRSAQQNLHLEEENVYYLGHEFASTETQIGENWYWQVIESKPAWRSRFSVDIPIVFEEEKNAEIRSRFHSIYYIVERSNNDYEIRFDLNNKYYWIEEFRGLENYDFPVDGINDRIINGANNLVIFSDSVVGNDFGRIGIDNFQLEGNFITNSYNGNIEFQKSVSQNQIQKVFSFPNSNIAAIDFNQGTIHFPSTNEEILLAGGIDPESSYSSLLLGDEYFSSIVPSYNILYRKDGESIHFSSDEIIDFNNELNQLNEKTAFVINVTKEINNQILTKLEQLGVNSLNSNSSNFLVFGNSSNLSETKVFQDDQNIINEFYEIESNGSSLFTANVFLNTGSHDFLVSEIKEDAEINAVKKSNLRDLSEKRYDIIYLTNSKYRNVSEAYVESRRNSYPDMEIDIVDVNDIYKEFDYGSKSPHAIKDFLSYIYFNQEGPAPSYLCIIGDANWDSQKRTSSAQESEILPEDDVPAYGLPVSDAWYGVLDSENDVNLDIMIGRIPINQSFDLLAYQDKVQRFENAQAAPWLKDMLMLIGGNDFETDNWYSQVRNVFDDMTYENFCGDTSSVINNTNSATSSQNASKIINELDKGKLWTIFAGHGSATLFDMDGWEVDKLRNRGKTGILSTAACNVGAFAEPSFLNSRSEEYVVYPEVGFIGVFSSTNFDVMEQDLAIIERMLYSLKDTINPSRTTGELINIGKAFLSMKGDWLNKVHQYGLLGDPTVKIPLSVEPDLYFANDYAITPIGNNDEVIDAADSILKVDLQLRNNGLSESLSFQVRAIHTYNGQMDTSFINISDHCYAEFPSFRINVLDQPGTHQVDILIDPDQETNELIRDNNLLTFSFDVFNKGLIPIDPLANWNVKSDEPVFRFIDPLNTQNTYSFEIFSLQNDLIYSFTNEEIIINSTHIDWIPNTILDENKQYRIVYELITPDETESKIGSLIFNTFSDSTDHNVDLKFDAIQESFIYSENIKFENGIAELTNDSIEVELLSSNGKGNYFSKSTIKVGDALFIDRDIRGFNVVTYPKFKESDIEPRFANYDTWGILGYDNNGLPIIDSSRSIKLVEFLKDSVSENEFLLLSVSNEGFRMMKELRETNPTSIGSLDSLVFYLKSYGSEWSDSLDNGWSYLAMFDPVNGKIIEKAAFRDSVMGESKVEIFNKKATLISRGFGPAKKWNSIEILGDNLSSSTVSISDELGNVVLEQELISSSFNIENTNSSYLDIELNILNSGLNSQAKLDEINVNFIPEPELTISSDKDTLESILRGDLLNFNVDLHNISLRTNSDSAYFNFILNEDINSSNKTRLTFNSKESLSFSLPTEFISGIDFIQLNAIDSTIKSEIIDFNNTYSVYYNIKEDTIPPVIIIKSENKEVFNQSFVAREPNLVVELYDNSNLPIRSINNFKQLNLNGFGNIRNSSTFEGSLDPEQNGDLRARVYLPNENLESGDINQQNQNFINVVAEDASGNTSEILINFNISENGYVLEPMNFPNPFEDEVVIQFEYAAPEDNNVTILIYDLEGRIVKTISEDITIGLNEINWDGKDNQGKSLSTGTYLYRIVMNGNVFVEPVDGKMIKVD